MAGAPANEATYRCAFEAWPATFPFKPSLRSRKVRNSVETATVVGPVGEEIHCDELGRVKVQFHWDQAGQRGEQSSCWIRVSQTWAGAGWGTQYIPRVGTEVVVAFLGGDPDRPLITGSVYNALYTLPVMSGRSGSPPRKATTTSVPTLGIYCVPQPAPAQVCETRIQHELCSPRWPAWSQ